MTTPPERIYGDSWPTFSPDGRTLVFGRIIAYPGNGDVHTLAFSEDLRPQGAPEQLTNARAVSLYPLWTENGREIIFFADRSLWRIRASGGGKPRRVAFTDEIFACPAINHRARRLTYTSALAAASDIWRVEVPLREKTAGLPAKLIASTRRDWLPRYSPDGSQIAFASDRSGASEIWRCDPDGSNPMQLTALGAGTTEFPSWSPDGKQIAFKSNTTGKMGVYVMNSDGTGRRRLTDGGAPVWSRDGRWIYFARGSIREPQIWKVPADGGEALRVAGVRGVCPFESPGGNFLYYTKSAVTAELKPLWRMPVAGGEEEQILDSVHNAVSYDVVEEGIYFVPGGSRGQEPSIRFHSFETGETSTVAPLPDFSSLAWGFDVSPDGRFILYTQMAWDFDLMLVEDFP